MDWDITTPAHGTKKPELLAPTPTEVATPIESPRPSHTASRRPPSALSVPTTVPALRILSSLSRARFSQSRLATTDSINLHRTSIGATDPSQSTAYHQPRLARSRVDALSPQRHPALRRFSPGPISNILPQSTAHDRLSTRPPHAARPVHAIVLCSFDGEASGKLRPQLHASACLTQLPEVPTYLFKAQSLPTTKSNNQRSVSTRPFEAVESRRRPLRPGPRGFCLLSSPSPPAGFSHIEACVRERC